MTREEMIEGDIQQKLGSVGFIIGAVLFVLSGLLMPHAARPTSDMQEMLKPLGEAQLHTILASLLGMLSFWGVFSGMAGVHYSIMASGAAWARMGFYFGLIGTTLWTVCWALDIATASAVSNWLAASMENKEAAWSVVAGLSAVGRGLVPTTWIIYWLALVLLNIAMLQSGNYPHWLGWVGLSVSIPVIALGVMQVFIPRSLTLTLLFSALMLFTIVWDLAIGIVVARSAWQKGGDDAQAIDTTKRYWLQ